MTNFKSQGATADQSVVYVYGVAHTPRGRQSAPLGLDGIIPGAPVQPLVHANLMAFVSAVPASQFGPTQFRSALNDTEWLKDRILAHDKVLEKLRFSYDVVPLRFGTIYPDTLQISNALAGHQAELSEALKRVQDASEWSVKLFCDQDRLGRRIETESVSIRQLRDKLGGASPGARFFLQKKYVTALQDEIAAATADWLKRIRYTLDACARDVAEIDVQSAAVHRRSAEMVMNAAYLVGEKSLGQFQEILATLQEEFAVDGFDCQLTVHCRLIILYQLDRKASGMVQRLINRNELALSDLLDRALNKGVVLWGDATISVAGVDLIYVGLKVLLASVDTAERLRQDARATPQVGAGAAE